MDPRSRRSASPTPTGDRRPSAADDVLLWRGVLHLSFVFNGFQIPDDIRGVPHWSLWTQAVLVWIWGASLAATLFAYHRATRARPD